MAAYTTRDKIWNVALTNESVHPSEFTEKFEISERTARDCLETMHEMGWLEKNGGKGSDPVRYSAVINPEPKEQLVALD